MKKKKAGKKNQYAVYSDWQRAFRKSASVACLANRKKNREKKGGKKKLKKISTKRKKHEYNNNTREGERGGVGKKEEEKNLPMSLSQTATLK